jgi:ABC-type polysaccharide/polyol phosphate transport system ATPase subunit
VNSSAIILDRVSVLFKVPKEPIGSLKEFAIRRVRKRLSYMELWALADVDLDVRPGEAVGVIGRNGAGKSTLLRLVARVMRPTAGRVRVAGSVAPLLELGAGFHPELTGRENVYLNAALLGHTRKDIDSKLGEIIDFSELEAFMDAPLRTYSSGMATRLGFAIATAWLPDVLLVDEALSVGDEKFKAKCGQRIGDFRNAGMTMLLVSHDLALVRSTCEHAVWLDHGRVRLAGRAKLVSDEYHQTA